MSAPARFGLVGSGWRSEFFARLARQAPDRFEVAGVLTRSADRVEQVAESWGVPAMTSLSDLVRTEPDFVIPCVPWSEMAPTTIELVQAGMEVLAETPPAADLPGLRKLWSEVGERHRVQVAEQYLYMPQHAARLQLAREGLIGQVTSVQVSSTHLYHAVSMIRGFLGVRHEPVTVVAQAFEAPLADPLSPSGWSGSDEAKPMKTTLAHLDFGDARMGVYDFTDNQWWNPLRARRLVVRGSHGEIVDDQVTRLVDPHTPVESRLIRRQSGIDLNLEGMDLQHVSFDGRVLYRNAYPGARFSEDDLAVVDLLNAMALWTRDEGPEPYPLADACTDHLISLAIGDAIRSGGPVTTTAEPWADR